ncbi:DNA primase [Lyticum sinuosum]|uniref:DNA primase n=1 Tax=Lyticum sinuosum TaxID=1332059 RepID=A0AAE4VM54_9RICK|nr:CHC2 zinc finger domain-containing protein [Lyticum sinuosum]MDZ5761471.1 DNA primase [Lyticum sinuosum]
MHSQIIRENCNIYDYISKYVDLKQRSHGEFLGICPFHDEKTPSFTVSEYKKFFHCFGCGEHGDIITFAMKYHNIQYMEAKKNIADIFKVDLPISISYKNNINQELYSINKISAEWYHENLLNNKDNNALKYLELRGLIDSNILKQYQIGFCPNNNKELINILKKNFSDNIIINSKILVFKHNISQFVNPLSGRIIFPIHDEFGNIIGFGGRILNDFNKNKTYNSNNLNYQNQNNEFIKQIPKYINSGETDIFKKREIFYGLYQISRHNIYNKQNYNSTKYKNDIYIVEGYFDVLSLAKQKQNVIASLGTAINQNHIHNLWNKGYNPVICFDGDNAGQNAMFRLIKESISDFTPEKNIEIVILKKDEDPSSISQKNILWSEYAQENRKSAINFIFDICCNITHNSKPEEKASVRQILKDIAKKVKHRELSSEYKLYLDKLYWQKIRQNNKNINNNFNNLNKYYLFENDINIVKLNKISQNFINIISVLILQPEATNSNIYERLSDLPDIYNEDLIKIKNTLLNGENWEDCSISNENKEIIINNIIKIKEKYNKEFLYQNLDKWLLIEENHLIEIQIKKTHQIILNEVKKKFPDENLLMKLEKNIISLKQNQQKRNIIINNNIDNIIDINDL